MPNATAVTRSATNRQVALLERLSSERDLSGNTAVEVARVLAGGAGSPIASDLIDRALAAPRRAVTVVSSDGATGAVDMLPTPSAATRAGRMLAAGSIEATATLADGTHVTVAIRTRTRSGRGWTNAELGADGSRTSISVLGSRVGWINRHGDQFRLTLRTRRDTVLNAVEGILAYCAGRPLPTHVTRVQEASRCGRCFRTLTDPVSIERGIGPECYGRSTGSRHADVCSTAPAPTVVTGVLRNVATAAEEASAALTAEAFIEAVEHVTRMTSVPAPAQRSLTEIAAVAASPVRTADEQRARDLIAEALDAYCGPDDCAFAMRTFDQLAAK